LVKLTYETWDNNVVKDIIKKQADYFDVLKWAYREFKNDEIVYACSFGAEGIVLIDLISKVNKQAKIIFLDTGLHFRETYELIEQIKERYPTLDIDMVKPKLTLTEQAEQYGEQLWKSNPNLCCQIRKVEPLKEAISGKIAWISGLRREQSQLRSKTNYLNKDAKFKNIKICPLILWKWEEILTYIELNRLPYNPLHDQGYPSIGCAPCTNPVSESNDQRAGRWSGNTKSECGLHLNN